MNGEIKGRRRSIWAARALAAKAAEALAARAAEPAPAPVPVAAPPKAKDNGPPVQSCEDGDAEALQKTVALALEGDRAALRPCLKPIHPSRRERRVATVAAAVLTLMAPRTEWTGTASDLLDALAEAWPSPAARPWTWPNSPRALAGRLRLAATRLDALGISLDFRREGHSRTRTIRIVRTGQR